MGLTVEKFFLIFVYMFRFMSDIKRNMYTKTGFVDWLEKGFIQEKSFEM